MQIYLTQFFHFIFRKTWKYNINFNQLSLSDSESSKSSLRNWGIDATAVEDVDECVVELGYNV